MPDAPIPNSTPGAANSRRGFTAPPRFLRPFSRSLLFVLLALGLMTIVQGFFSALFPGPLGPFGLAAQTAGIATAWLLLSWLMLLLADQRSFRTLGLWFYSGSAREFAVGVGIGAGMISLVVLLQVSMGAVRYVGVTSHPLAAARTVAALAVVLIVAAAAEEIAFRGYGLQRLLDAVGPVPAVLTFSALFGLVHLQNPGATRLSTVNTVLAGALLSVAYLKTRALWLPIGLHWGWNFFMTGVFSLPVSGFGLGGEFGELPFRVEFNGPAVMTGGTYGPEGTIVLTIVTAAAIGLLVRTARITPSPAMEQALKSSLG